MNHALGLVLGSLALAVCALVAVGVWQMFVTVASRVSP